jgi:hypothetical protein
MKSPDETVTPGWMIITLLSSTTTTEPPHVDFIKLYIEMIFTHVREKR